MVLYLNYFTLINKNVKGMENLKEKKLFEALGKIPMGTTCSYSEISAKAGFKNSTRYAAGLLKKNRRPIAVPCHRVIKKNGDYGEYMLGKEFKKFLIDREKEILS